MTELLCDVLELMNRESYVMAYKDEPEMDAYCLNHYIQSTKLFKDYSSHLKKVLKDIVLKSIEVLGKKILLNMRMDISFTIKFLSRKKPRILLEGFFRLK